MDLVASALGLVGKIILNEIEVVLSCYLKTLYETKVIPESEPFMHTPQKKIIIPKCALRNVHQMCKLHLSAPKYTEVHRFVD